MPGTCLFRSFWMGGFECSTHINGPGVRLDMIAATEHDLRCEQDYACLRSVGIGGARDGTRWHLIDKGGRLDFSSFLPQLKASLHHNVQVIWDLFHYGYPDDIDLFSPAFVKRFARFAKAVAQVFADHTDEVPFWTPVNEISFFAWAASRPGIFPYATGRDDAIKTQLVRAAIAAAEAVWDVDRRARLVYPEPLLHILAPSDRPDLQRIARIDRESHYAAWDMLAGHKSPWLGGAPKYLDIVGVNFYCKNQWEQLQQRMFLRWMPDERDPRWAPLDDLLATVYQRYGRPILVSETGHYGEGRSAWLRQIANEAHAARLRGIPLEGVCLYPIVDRHEWDNPNHWHYAGLWDVERDATGACHRILNQDFAGELQRSRERLETVGCR